MVKISSLTGGDIARWPLGQNISHRVVDGVTQTNKGPVDATHPIVLQNGTVTAVGYSYEQTSEYHFDENQQVLIPINEENWTYTDSLRVFELSAAGSLAVRNISLSNYQDNNCVCLSTMDIHTLLPDGNGGLLVARPSASAIYRIASNDVLTGPLDLGVRGEVDYVIGEDAAYAVIQKRPNEGLHNGWVISFNPASLAVSSSADLFGFQRFYPRLTLEGGGAFLSSLGQDYFVNATVPNFTSSPLGLTHQVAPGIWAGWWDGPGLSVASVAPLGKTVWAQSRGDGQGRNQSPDERLGIFLKGHAVFGEAHHVGLRIVPRDQALWRMQSSYFTDTPGDGIENTLQAETSGQEPVTFATLGAGSSNAIELCQGGGSLVGAANRERDVNVPPVTRNDFARSDISPSLEDAVIERLFELDGAYDDDLNYVCYPDPTQVNGYNSNSYAAGLIIAAKLRLPLFPLSQAGRYPGYIKPVPPTAFVPD